MRLNLEKYDYEDMAKRIANENMRRQWGYSNEDLAIKARQFRIGGLEQKIYIYNLLEDANFHQFAEWLNNENYEACEKAIGLQVVR